MNDEYINEVLPRWQFWKEHLIEQLEKYRESLKKEHPEILEIFDDEMVEKIEKAETAESLKQASEEVWNTMWGLYKKFDDYEYEGVCEKAVTNRDTLSSWLDMENLTDEIIRKIK
jgi:alpha-L-fucosidase